MNKLRHKEVELGRNKIGILDPMTTFRTHLAEGLRGITVHGEDLNLTADGRLLFQKAKQNSMHVRHLSFKSTNKKGKGIIHLFLKWNHHLFWFTSSLVC